MVRRADWMAGERAGRRAKTANYEGEAMSIVSIEEQPTTILPRNKGAAVLLATTTEADNLAERREREYHAALIESYVARVRSARMRCSAELARLHEGSFATVAEARIYGALAAQIRHEFNRLISDGFRLSQDVCPEAFVDFGGSS